MESMSNTDKVAEVREPKWPFTGRRVRCVCGGVASECETINGFQVRGEGPIYLIKSLYNFCTGCGYSLVDSKQAREHDRRIKIAKAQGHSVEWNPAWDEPLPEIYRETDKPSDMDEKYAAVHFSLRGSAEQEQLANLIAHIRATERAATLEEAAKVCDDTRREMYGKGGNWATRQAVGAAHCTTAIRALIKEGKE